MHPRALRLQSNGRADLPHSPPFSRYGGKWIGAREAKGTAQRCELGQLGRDITCAVASVFRASDDELVLHPEAARLDQLAPFFEVVRQKWHQKNSVMMKRSRFVALPVQHPSIRPELISVAEPTNQGRERSMGRIFIGSAIRREGERHEVCVQPRRYLLDTGQEPLPDLPRDPAAAARTVPPTSTTNTDLLAVSRAGEREAVVAGPEIRLSRLARSAPLARRIKERVGSHQATLLRFDSRTRDFSRPLAVATPAPPRSSASATAWRPASASSLASLARLVVIDDPSGATQAGERVLPLRRRVRRRGGAGLSIPQLTLQAPQLGGDFLGWRRGLRGHDREPLAELHVADAPAIRGPAHPSRSTGRAWPRREQLKPDQERRCGIELECVSHRVISFGSTTLMTERR